MVFWRIYLFTQENVTMYIAFPFSLSSWLLQKCSWIRVHAVSCTCHYKHNCSWGHLGLSVLTWFPWQRYSWWGMRGDPSNYNYKIWRPNNKIHDQRYYSWNCIDNLEKLWIRQTPRVYFFMFLLVSLYFSIPY